MSALMTPFSNVTDILKEKGKRHSLIDIIVIAIVGVIYRADDWVMIEQAGKAKAEWLRTFLELSHGIPSHDTFGKVFDWINPEEFQNCFMEWIQDVADMTAGKFVAIDGKTVRRSYDSANGKKPIHLVNVWASQNELVIGQRKVEENRAYRVTK